MTTTTTLANLTIAIGNRIQDITPSERPEFEWVQTESTDLAVSADPRVFYVEVEPGAMRPDGVLSEVVQMTTRLRVHCSYRNLTPAAARSLIIADRMQLWDVISDNLDPIPGLWQGFPADDPWTYLSRQDRSIRGTHNFDLDYVIQG